MISPMRKYTFVVFRNDYEDFMRDLQKLGVVHVVEKKSAVDDEGVRGLGSRAARINRARQILKKREINETVVPVNDYTSADDIIAELDRCQQEIEKLDQSLMALKKEISILQPWGDVPSATVEALDRERIRVRYFAIQNKKFSDAWLTKYAMAVVEDDGLRKYCVVFTREGEEAPVLPGAEELRLPARVLSTSVSEREKSIAESAALSARMTSLAAGNAPEVLRAELARVLSETDYARAVLSADAGVEDQVRIVQGWVPRDRESLVVNASDARGVVTMAEEPQEGEKVPIELKNGAFARLFEPITRMFDLPSYVELDLTPMFAPFFMFFFGLCLGDGGYGAVILLATAIAYFKVKKDFKPLCMLGMVFGAASLIVGILLGGVFGMDLAEKFPESRQLFLLYDKQLLFYFAIGVGVVQILFGMTMRIINRWRKSGFLTTLSTFGWIFLVLGILGMALGDAIGEAVGSAGFGAQMGVIAPYITFLGLGLILLFNDMKVNVFVRIGKGLWELYNITGIVGDMLSYVRLFALGLAGGILGMVVNMIATMFIDMIPVVGLIICGVILLVGHAGVLLLGAFGAFVHPMRLTFVEFYKNAGFTGGGRAYKPLAARKIK